MELRENLRFDPPKTEHCDFIDYIKELLYAYGEHARERAEAQKHEQSQEYVQARKEKEEQMADQKFLQRFKEIETGCPGIVHKSDRYIFSTVEEFESFLLQLLPTDLTKKIVKDEEQIAKNARAAGQEVVYMVWLSRVGNDEKPAVMPFIHIPLLIGNRKY